MKILYSNNSKLDFIKSFKTEFQIFNDLVYFNTSLCMFPCDVCLLIDCLELSVYECLNESKGQLSSLEVYSTDKDVLTKYKSLTSSLFLVSSDKSVNIFPEAKTECTPIKTKQLSFSKERVINSNNYTSLFSENLGSLTITNFNSPYEYFSSSLGISQDWADSHKRSYSDISLDYGEFLLNNEVINEQEFIRYKEDFCGLKCVDYSWIKNHNVSLRIAKSSMCTYHYLAYDIQGYDIVLVLPFNNDYILRVMQSKFNNILVYYTLENYISNTLKEMG